MIVAGFRLHAPGAVGHARAFGERGGLPGLGAVGYGPGESDAAPIARVRCDTEIQSFRAMAGCRSGITAPPDNCLYMH